MGSGERGTTQVTLSLHEARALEISLQHGTSCVCANCTTAVSAVRRVMKPFKAIGSPRDEDIARADAEIARAKHDLALAHRKKALLVGADE